MTALISVASLVVGGVLIHLGLGRFARHRVDAAAGALFLGVVATAIGVSLLLGGA